MWMVSGANISKADERLFGPSEEGHCVSLWPDATWNVAACSGDTYSVQVCPCEVAVTQR